MKKVESVSGILRLSPNISAKKREFPESPFEYIVSKSLKQFYCKTSGRKVPFYVMIEWKKVIFIKFPAIVYLS